MNKQQKREILLDVINRSIANEGGDINRGLAAACWATGNSFDELQGIFYEAVVAYNREHGITL